ncbi:MAG: acyl-CoA thioester hydrolase/BAAT C-terminal domain-containing protein [Planctomycetota bacterium]
MKYAQTHGGPSILMACILLLGTSIRVSSAEPSRPRFRLPDTILAGDGLSIRIVGLEPKTRLRIQSERIAGWRQKRLHRASVWVRSDDAGNVDLSKQAPLLNTESSYDGVEPLGLLWSMTPVEEEARETLNCTDSIRFTASRPDDGELATFQMRIQTRRDDVEETPLGDPGLEGAFVMMRPSDTPRPVIITLGGSEGGDSSARRTAPVLASHGFAVVGVPYYSPAYGSAEPRFKTLPRSFSNIPLDRLNDVLDAIEQHPKLDSKRIGLHGVSKGGEFVLAIASRLDRFQAVVGVVPSDVIWEGWGSEQKTSSFSYHGKPLPFVPYQGMKETIAKLSKGERVSIRVPHDAGRAAFPESVPAAKIEVEKIKCPLMIIGGDQDQTWDSGGMCRQIVERRKSAGLETEAWIGTNAGHYLAGHAFDPMAFAGKDASFRTKTFPAMLAFLREHLQGND